MHNWAYLTERDVVKYLIIMSSQQLIINGSKVRIACN